MIKRFSAVLLAALLALCAACTAAPAAESGGIRAVCTAFPQYDWARTIAAGTDAEVTLIADSGADIHSYMPTADDMVAIATADVLIYIGGASDAWVAGAETVNGAMIRINMMETGGVTVYGEELTEGMQAGDEGEDGEADEHCWLSLKNAAAVCRAIAAAFAEADPDNAAVYEANCAAYIAELDALDAEYTAAVGGASLSSERARVLLVADRFPFRYMVEDYGIDYYAAFPGCSAETEASFDTISRLADRVRELGLPAVICLDTGDGSIAEAVVAAAGTAPAIIRMYAIQSVTADELAAGATYLSLMEKNLEALKTALK